MYPHNIISKCQSLAKHKDFICFDCKWSENADNRTAYCSKVGFDCNGDQSAPVNWCLDFELPKAPESTESAQPKAVAEE